MMSISKFIMLFIAIFLMLNGLILLLNTNFNLGNILCIIFGFCLMFFSVGENILKPTASLTLYTVIKWVTLSISLFVFACSCFLNIYGMYSNCTFKEDAVIVLGAGIRGTKVASPLSYRLDSACEYLNDNKRAVVVVSGGQGYQEEISEAEAMKRYLTEKGIAAERIICEDKSTSTYENFKFSKQILDKKFSHEYKTVIITNNFHVFRAERIAREVGISCTHKGARLKWYSIVPNSLRECFALAKNLVFGR